MQLQLWAKTWARCSICTRRWSRCSPTTTTCELVNHAGEDAYTVVAVPDYLTGSFLCEKESTSHPYEPPTGSAKQVTYGNYYATLFALRTPGEHPAALSLLWNKENGQWKIIAYQLMTP